MKRSGRRILIIVLSIMVIMTYMIPGSVFADTAVASDGSDSLEVHEHDHAIEELTEEDDGADAVITDTAEDQPAEDPVEEGGEAVEEVPVNEGTEEVTEETTEEAPAEETVTEEEPAPAKAPALRAAANGLTVLAFTSDTHNTANNTAANRLGTWIDKMKELYGTIDLMAFGGDMAGASLYGDSFWTPTQADMDQLSQRNLDAVYTTGNHEYMNGSYTNGSNSTTRAFKEDVEAVNADTYRMYCLGSGSYADGGGWNTYSTSQITKLTNYLNSAGNDKPIFIITHYPLHWTSARSVTNADRVIDALNTAATSNGQKIVFLWGHNHTDANNSRVESHYDEIFAPGESIQYANGSGAELNFYYAAAGCMSDSEYGAGSGAVKGKGLIVTINSKNQLSFAYHDANANNVTEDGTGGQGTSYTEQDPVAVTGVTVSPSPAEVLERKTVQLTATIAPEDATTRSVRWSSSNTSIATVDGTGLVKGVAEGQVTITATTVDGGFTASSTVTVLHNDDPSVEVKTEITPSTSNPEQSITINAGDTLVIDVTNGSSNSAYDFTATVANSSVARVQGNATVNIAAGGTGQIVVEGLTDGTTDINISNNSTYGTQYARRAVIHLTVGEGGSTPVDPPTGDTVNITPSTDNPEQSIKINVGDTLTINTTNGSSNSAYDFTATLSNSGIAQIQGNATVNIAAGGTGQFTVVGLADGTVDITIQNNNTYGSQYARTGVIHLTVGEGGSTPVDPPTGDTVNITPSTDNPEQSIKINVGDTLTINTTNGSSNSAYDFTATLSNSGIAQIQGNATVNIAAGGTGQFTVKGLAEGTVDITIQNNNTYGSQYTRTGIIHLTVGEGGSTPIDPPVGDTVTYQQANTLEAGKDYIIVSGNSGNVYVLSTDANGSRTLKGIAATVSDGLITLSAADAAKAEFTAEGRGTAGDSLSVWLKNGSQYLYTDSNSGLRMESSSTQTSSSNSNKVWHYKADDKNLLWYFNSNSADGYTDTSSTYKYYLEVSSGNFTDNHADSTSLANTNTPKIYLFEEYEGPIEVTGVSLDKTTLTLGTGQTRTLTATVIPSGATNKNVTWSSSNPSVATVDQNGKVTGVSEGTATITVTTEEGSKTATCAVTVTAEAPKTGYVIVIDGFALSTDRSPNQAQGGSSSYTYTGLAGVAYTAGDDLTDNILWNLEETNGGYYIKSQDGLYLNGTYTSGSNSGQGNLKVDNTPDVWVLDGTIEDWMVDGAMLRSTNATNSTPDRPKFLGYEDSANLFTVRSEENADESQLIDPTVTIEERFVETTTLEDGKEYIIAVTKDSGSVYAIKNTAGTGTGNTGSATLTVTPASGSNPAYIETDDIDVVWTYQSSNQYMLASTGSSHYLGYESSTYLPRTSSQGRAIIYSGGKLQITSGHYLTCDNGTFATNTSSSSGANVRLFVKSMVIVDCDHEYGDPVWTWTGSVNTRAAVTATATFTCTKCGEQVVVNADVTSATDSSGHVVYTATATGPDGKTYTDTKAAAEEGEYTITISAEPTEVAPGDEVTFTITLGPVDKFGSFQMVPVIPEGLTYVANSFIPTGGKEALKEALGFDDVDWTESTMRFTGFSLDKDYVSTEDTVLATFKCTVDDGFTSSAKVDLTRLEFYSSTDWELNLTDLYEIIPATVTYRSHTHTPGTAVKENEVAATCTTAGGYDEVVYCTGCGEEMSRTHVDVPALGHDWQFVNFTWTGSDEEGYTAAVANYRCRNDATHTRTVNTNVTSTTTEASCDNAGSKVYTTTVGAAESLDGISHTDTRTVVIPATGHDWGTPVWEWTGNAETGYTGLKGTFTCQNDSEHVQIVETTDVTVDKKDPTPTESGYIKYSAKVTGPDGKEYSDTIEIIIPAEGYTYKDPVYTWTETDDGYSVVALKECNEDPAQNITETVTATFNVTTPATCEAEGEGTYTATFTKSAFETQTKVVTIDALGHDWKFENFTWTGSDEAGYTAAAANYVCKNDATHTQTVNATVTSEITAATCDTDGKTVYTATVTAANSLDGEAHTADRIVAIPATGHDWGEATYGWSDDNSKVIATRTCKNDPTHKETETVDTTSIVTEPTCTAKGKIVYTATFTTVGFEDQTRTIEIDMIAHTPVTDPGKPATCIETGLTEGSHCSVCGEVLVAQEVIPLANHIWGEPVMIKEPVYLTPGLFEYTCTVCGEVVQKENGWVKTDEGDWIWRFIKETGEWAANEWVYDHKGYCWIQEDGICAVDTWFDDPVSGNTYYLKHGGYIAIDEWINDGKNWYYMDKEGIALKSKWLSWKGDWYYLKADGTMAANEWAKDSKGQCWMLSSGKMAKDKWIQADGEWYYMNSSGYITKNAWAKDSKGWCWMDANGKITKDKWIKDGGEWYYLKANGYMAASEWAKDSKGWMYMDGSGKITKSKWIQYKGDWYYLKADGYMATGTQTIGGVTYRFDSSGKWIS